MSQKHWIIIVGVIVVLSVLRAVFILSSKTNDASDNGGDFKSISMDEAKEIFQTKGDYIILDVRRADEYATGHIPGAINVANEDIASEPVDELPDMNQTIYVYCRSGRRSKAAAKKLVSIGYTNIIDCGGIMSWKGSIEK